jgi:hypothetical protein
MPLDMPKIDALRPNFDTYELMRDVITGLTSKTFGPAASLPKGAYAT